jgi:hypothetical protein
MHSWLYVQDTSGLAYEVINGARTFGYLGNPALAINGLSACQSFGTCATYPYKPYLGQTIPGSFNFTGVAGNFLSAPDAAALDIVGDIALVAQIAPANWAAANGAVVGKWSTASNQSYQLTYSAGTIAMQWSNLGTNSNSIPSSTSVLSTTPANTAKWIAAVLDVDNGASGRTAYFWTSTDGLNWTAYGTPQTTATATSLFSGTSPIFVGAQPGRPDLQAVRHSRLLDVRLRHHRRRCRHLPRHVRADSHRHEGRVPGVDVDGPHQLRIMVGADLLHPGPRPGPLVQRGLPSVGGRARDARRGLDRVG